MSIDKKQEDVLLDESKLMDALEAAADAYKCGTALGQQIQRGWRGTFGHYRQANNDACGYSQSKFDAGLGTERAQLQVFLAAIIPGTADEQSWRDHFQEEIEIIDDLLALHP